MSELYLIYLQADVYVNTTNTRLDLTSGAISQLLLKSGGPELRAECDKKAPISVGDVATTGGGKVECRHIFHVVIPGYDGPGGQAEKVILSICVFIYKPYFNIQFDVPSTDIKEFDT